MAIDFGHVFLGGSEKKSRIGPSSGSHLVYFPSDLQ